MSKYHQGAAPVASDGWEATRAQTALATQFVNEEEYLAVEKQDVGRLTGADTRELFVSCDPAQALQQQFEHLQPDFIAVHDIATASSRKLLAGIAAASGRRIQKLVIRRQGYGTALASVEFIELPTAQGKLLRMYSTEAEADTAARQGLARMLLGFSRLAVLMVGDLPPHSMEPALAPIHSAMIAGPWPNRQMLLLPLAAASTLVSHGIALSQGTGVNVRTTPQVTRPADAWGFITSSWSRIGEPAVDATRGGPNLAAVPTAQRPASLLRPGSGPVPAPAPPAPTMREMPPVPSPRSRQAAPPPDIFGRYLEQLGQVAGMVSCCIFDVASGRDIAHTGAGPSATQLAVQGAQLVTAMGATSRALGFGQVPPDAAISFGAHHLLLRPLPGHPGLALHAVLDKAQANLTLARLQIQRMDALLTDTPA